MISFIISIFNQKNYLEYWLKSLNWIFDNQFHEFELVIADDNSTDGSREFLETNPTKYPTKYYYELQSGFNKSYANYMAAQLAEGKHFYFFDGDTFIDSTTIPTALNIINHIDSMTIINGIRYRFDWNRIKDNFTLDFSKIPHWLDMDPKKPIPPASYKNFSGSNYIISKELYRLCGGHPQHLSGRSCDDYILLLSALAVGGKSIPANNLYSYHVMHNNTEGHPNWFNELQNAENTFRDKILTYHPGYII